MVADAFELDRDPQGRQHLAQIDRPWLPQRQYPDHQIINLVHHAIGFRLPLDDAAGKLGIRPFRGFGRCPELRAGKLTHIGHHALEAGEFLLKRLHHVLAHAAISQNAGRLPLLRKIP